MSLGHASMTQKGAKIVHSKVVGKGIRNLARYFAKIGLFMASKMGKKKRRNPPKIAKN